MKNMIIALNIKNITPFSEMGNVNHAQKVKNFVMLAD
jgi:hypothetical protein